MNQPTSPLLSHDEAAAYLHTTGKNLHQWNWKRRGPRSYRAGRNRLYRAEDLDAWLEAHATDPGDQRDR